MYRFFALACLASLTSGCLMTLAAGVPLPDPASPGKVADPVAAGADVTRGGDGQTLQQQLQGAWLYETGDGSDMVLTFLPDGTVTGHPAGIPPSAGLILTGQYQLAGDMLTFAFPGISPVSGTLSFSADGQTMIMGNAALRRYRL